MENNIRKPLRTFQPRPSSGWCWFVLMATIIIARPIVPALAMGVSPKSSLLTLIICIPVALGFMILAIWFPTMRYELYPGLITLRYGPVLCYHIPLDGIHTNPLELYNISFMVPFIILAVIFERMRRVAREPGDDLHSREVIYWHRQNTG